MCPARVAAKNGALKRYARSIMLLYAKSVSQIITSDEIFKSGLSFCLFHQNIFLRCKKLFINFNTHTCRDLCSRVKSLLGHMCPGWFLGKRTSLKKSANVKVHWEPMTSCVTNKNPLIKKRKFSDFLESRCWVICVPIEAKGLAYPERRWFCSRRDWKSNQEKPSTAILHNVPCGTFLT